MKKAVGNIVGREVSAGDSVCFDGKVFSVYKVYSRDVELRRHEPGFTDVFRVFLTYDGLAKANAIYVNENGE